MKTETLRLVLFSVLFVLVGTNLWMTMLHLESPRHSGAMHREEIEGMFKAYEHELEEIRKDLRSLVEIRKDIKVLEKEQSILKERNR